MFVTKETVRPRARVRTQNFRSYIRTSDNAAACAMMARICRGTLDPTIIVGLEGQSGSGKSHLLRALGHSVLDRHKGARIMLASGAELLSAYTAAHQRGRDDRLMADLTECRALLIDGWRDLLVSPSAMAFASRAAVAVRRRGYPVVLADSRSLASFASLLPIGHADPMDMHVVRLVPLAGVDARRALIDLLLRDTLWLGPVPRSFEAIAHETFGAKHDWNGHDTANALQLLADRCAEEAAFPTLAMACAVARVIEAERLGWDGTRILLGALDDQGAATAPARTLDREEVMAAVCGVVGDLDWRSLFTSHERGRPDVELARHLTVYVLRRGKETAMAIGHGIGRDHTTVLHSERRVKTWIEEGKPDVTKALEQVRRKLHLTRDFVGV